MGRDFSLTPKSFPRVETAYRRIVTALPAPGSVETLEKLYKYEPVAMRGQPPIVWDRADGFQVYDGFGNCWIDWSSGVLITNAGHGRQEIVDAVVSQAQHKLLTNYCFPSEIRARLVEKLATMFGEPDRKAFLLTTGSEAVECAIKLCRTHGVKVGGRSKNVRSPKRNTCTREAPCVRRITVLIEVDRPWAVAFWTAVGYPRDDRIVRHVGTMD